MRFLQNPYQLLFELQTIPKYKLAIGTNRTKLV